MSCQALFRLGQAPLIPRQCRVKPHPCRVMPRQCRFKPHPARQYFNCHTYAS
ncbi:hypothetical protein BDR05DRAFT_960385, partial [Suillus weaverae]